jgi:DNA-binding protein Alba
MDKYTRVQKEKEPTGENEIRISSQGRVSNYISYAGQLFNEQGKDQVEIRATGQALPKAVQVAEVVKRRFAGLHQITTLGSTEIENEYEPTEEGLNKVTQTTVLSIMRIVLSKTPLDTTAIGYQPPIPESEVGELIEKPRRGKGAKAEGEEGEDDGEEKPKKKGGKSKGKGKGKGKDKGKGKGKGNGKGKAKAKGNGKGKGKK